MLVFSLYNNIFKVITSYFILHNNNTFFSTPSPPLPILPERYHNCSNFILIYMSFWGLFFSAPLSIFSFIYRNIYTTKTKTSIKKSSSYHFNRLHLFILIYLLSNIGIVTAIHTINFLFQHTYYYTYHFRIHCSSEVPSC
jgi:hypothetical protein